jgi:pyruvate kinase
MFAQVQLHCLSTASFKQLTHTPPAICALPAASASHLRLQCQDVPTLVRMLEAGVTCARVDLSWGTKQYHARSLTNLGEAMKQTRRLCR